MADPPLRILITGSRRLTDPAPIRRKIIGFLAELQLDPVRDPSFAHARVVIVHGAQRGADELAAKVARELGFTPEAHPAEKFGPWPQCGPKRNTHMVSLGARICFAFPCEKSTGTWDCVMKAVRAHIPVRTYLQRLDGRDEGT